MVQTPRCDVIQSGVWCGTEQDVVWYRHQDVVWYGQWIVYHLTSRCLHHITPHHVPMLNVTVEKHCIALPLSINDVVCCGEVW